MSSGHRDINSVLSLKIHILVKKASKKVEYVYFGAGLEVKKYQKSEEFVLNRHKSRSAWGPQTKGLSDLKMSE